MSVRAKFKCEEITENTSPGGSRIVLRPVVCGSEENEKFFNLTPFGNIEIGTINPDAAKEFEVGAEFYVDFTKAE